MIGNALEIGAPPAEFVEQLQRRKELGRHLDHPDLRDGPKHVITGGRQEGKTTLALAWLFDAPAGVERVLVVMTEEMAKYMKRDNGLKDSDQRIISYRRLLNGGARKGVEYGIDETVEVLTALLKLKETPHLVTVAHAEEWQG